MRKPFYEWFIHYMNGPKGIFMRKRTGAITLALFTFCLSANALSQVFIELSGPELSYEELFTAVNQQTGLTVIYNNDRLDQSETINVDPGTSNVEILLAENLKDKNLGCEIKDDYLIISPKNASTSFAQQDERVISGFVKDENGEPLPGVTVMIKGTQIGTATGFDGEFSLKVPDQYKIILVSFIGMETQEINITGKTEIKVVLQSSLQDIDEVVVTGYQKVDRKLFTGSAAKVKMDEIKIASESDISKSLEGQVAGVSVQNVSSTFGSAPNIKIRGASSIYGDQKPLWVVDGIVLEDAVEVSMNDLMSGDLNTLISSGVAGLNMDDVESFQVLKDVSATAIYGARAMNGVIVITTKSGRKGSLDVNYSTNITIKPTPSYEDYNILNSVDQMSINRELYEKGWINVAKTQSASDHGPYGKMFGLIADNELNWVNGNDEINNFLRRYETANTNWFKELFKTGVQQQHTVSISGGGEKASFYTSLGYLHDDGWTIADKVDRYTSLLKGTFNITDKFKVTTASNMSYRDQQLSGASQSKDDVGGVNRYTGKIDRTFDNNPFIYAMTTSRNITPRDEHGNPEFFRKNYADYNVINELESNQIGVNVMDMSFSADFNYEIKKNLILSSRVSARFYNAETTRTVHEDSNEANSYRAGVRPNDSELIANANGLLYEQPGSTTGIKYSILPEGGIYEVSNDKMENYYLNASANWNPRLGDSHMFTFLLGSEVRYIDRSNNWNHGYGHFYDMGNISKPSPNFLEKRSMEGRSYFGKADTFERFVAYYLNYGYSYLGRYTINGTVRYEGSNRLGKSRTARWLPTWNISAKWAMQEENFLKNKTWINQLNLRAAYGLNAIRASASNASVYATSAASSRPFHPEASELEINIVDVENSDLTWEKQYEFNAGIEFAIFKHRISGEFDYYTRKGFDLIGNYQSNGVGGKRMKLGNVADMDSYGFEAFLNVVPVASGSFKWISTINYSYNKSEITNLETSNWVGPATSIYGVPVLDGPVRGVYSSRFAGLDDHGVPQFYDRDNNKVHYLNVQTDDFADFKFEGTLDPTNNLGFNNSFSFKGITLSGLISGQFGHKKRVMQNFNYKYTDSDALNTHLKNRWRVKGDENITGIPAILDADFLNKPNSSKIKTAYNLYGMSDYWMADASFIRLKNVSLTYKLPKSLINKIGMKSASIGVHGTNLAILWQADKDKLNGEDPEFVWSGGTTMPIVKQYTFTLNVGF
ncbi:SusC/RagA family TonB-linked outer membrane protein [Marinilabiliaceae bacterium JC017]|nr:SusC/RagA family TonB-linked outer membrane protein [Marinilabiliaceae bacterium JC017]